MPALAAAHTALDKAVDKCYRDTAFASDRAHVEFLFALYEHLTAPLAASAKPKRPSRRARPTSPPLPAGEGRGEGESVGGPSE